MAEFIGYCIMGFIAWGLLDKLIKFGKEDKKPEEDIEIRKYVDSMMDDKENKQ